MNKLISCCVFTAVLLCGLLLQAQDTVNYKGDLNISKEQSMPLTLQIITLKDTVKVLMGSPSQTNQLIPATKTKITEDSVKFNISNMSVKVRLKYINGKQTLHGTFKQGLLNKEITFERTESLFAFNRPQTPLPPFPYKEKELSFTNPQCEYVFHGTLTYPDNKALDATDNKKYPIAVLVSGSGCQNRDEEIFQHKPFMVIADYLTRNGIAVFRYDDRGFGSKDTNMYKGTTYDFACDTRQAVQMLKNEDMIDKDNIFIIGHSEGGMICEILGAKYDDIKGLILMAAPAVSGKEILMSQTEAIMRLNGASQSDIDRALQETENVKYDTSSINGMWLDYFYHFEPAEYLKKINNPLLILQGGKDMQVLCDLNIKAMRKYLPESQKNRHEKVYPDLNHLFQHCKTGNPDEYALTEETISTEVLKDIKEFILQTVK